MVGSKKSVQQGRSHFYARSVCVIREHGKMGRTPLAAFFNRPINGMGVEHLSTGLKTEEEKTIHRASS